jgi:hypothetical protein
LNSGFFGVFRLLLGVFRLLLGVEVVEVAEEVVEAVDGRQELVAVAEVGLAELAAEVARSGNLDHPNTPTAAGPAFPPADPASAARKTSLLMPQSGLRSWPDTTLSVAD